MCLKIGRGPEVEMIQSVYDRSKKTKEEFMMNVEINRMVTEGRMQEMRDYAFQANTVIRKKSSKKTKKLAHGKRYNPLIQKKIG